MREDVGICLTRKDPGLGFWWENESLVRSENPQELSAAIDSMMTLLSNLKDLRAEDAIKNQAFVKSDAVLHHATQDQTLNLQSTSAICCIPDDLPETYHEITQEPYQTLNLQSSTSTICCVPDDDLPANFNEITEEQDQILTICESLCVTDNNALPEGNLDYDQEMDTDQLIDFDTPFESSLDDWFSDNTHQELQETTPSVLTNSEAVYDHVSMKTTNTNLLSEFEAFEDGDLMLQRCLDEDNIRYSDLFNDFTTSTIAAI